MNLTMSTHLREIRLEFERPCLTITRLRSTLNLIASLHIMLKYINVEIL